MLDLVDLSGERELSHTVLQSCLAEVDTLSELAGVFSVEEQREARDVLDLARVAHLNLVLVGLVVVANDTNGLPSILVVSEAG